MYDEPSYKGQKMDGEIEIKNNIFCGGIYLLDAPSYWFAAWRAKPAEASVLSPCIQMRL